MADEVSDESGMDKAVELDEVLPDTQEGKRKEIEEGFPEGQIFYLTFKWIGL
jgi:hypothetical protein